MLSVKNLCALLLNLGLLASLSAQGLDTTDYFPLHVGDTWWTIGLGGGYWGPGSSQVTGMINIRDTTYFVMDSISLYRKDSVGNVYRRVNGIDQLYYKLTATAGEKWPVNPEGTMEMSLLVASEDLATPLGRFRNCKVFMLKPAAGGFDNDFFYTLAPGIGLVAYDTNPIADEHWRVRRAIIDGRTVSSPFHVTYGTLPWSAEQNVDPATVITIRFDSPTDTISVARGIKVTSKRTGEVIGSVHFQADNSRLYVFRPREKFSPADTITVSISAGIRDIFGEGLDGNGNWKYDGSPADDYSWTFFTQIVTGVECPIPEPVPLSFSVSPNYPNPFNPTTTIPFVVPRKSVVTLVVYNVLGERIATLVDGTKPPGKYEVRFDGSELASGVYFCRMNASNYTSIRKLMMVK
ncbi:MAG: Ig-like domain-containing protein [Bacteroidota bacterium]